MVTPHFYLKKLDLSVADYSLLYAQGTSQKSYGPILNLPILTATNFLKNTNIPIPIIPIIGSSLVGSDCHGLVLCCYTANLVIFCVVAVLFNS